MFTEVNGLTIEERVRKYDIEEVGVDHFGQISLCDPIVTYDEYVNLLEKT